MRDGETELVREDDSERAQDFGERHIRRAVERQDAQTQLQPAPDIATDSAPHDMQPYDDKPT